MYNMYMSPPHTLTNVHAFDSCVPALPADASVCFRVVVLSRPTGQLAYGHEGPSKALAEATETDQGQMLCFLRRLDNDDDAHVTLESFCQRMTKQGGGGWAVLRSSVAGPASP